MTSEWTVVPDPLGLLAWHVFFSFLILSRASYSSLQPPSPPPLFPYALHSAPSKGNLLFIAFCGGMRSRKEDGKTACFVATMVKNRKRKKKQLCLADNSVESDVIKTDLWGDFDWPVPIVAISIYISQPFLWESRLAAGCRRLWSYASWLSGCIWMTENLHRHL